MSIDQWPCIPDSLADFVDEDVIRFVIAGVSEKHGLPLNIVEGSGEQYDPFNLRQNYQPFCAFLRGRLENDEDRFPGADEQCRKWDKMVAREALSDPRSQPMALQGYPCWMGLRDYIVIAETGGYTYALSTGQYRREKGESPQIDSIHALVDKWAKTMQLRDKQLLDELKGRINQHPVATPGDRERILTAVRDIDWFFHSYWQKQRSIAESQILDWMSVKLARLSTRDMDLDWQALEKVLEEMAAKLGCHQVLCFASEARRLPEESGNILRLKASVGLSEENRAAPPHFNWKKAECTDGGLALILDPQSGARIWMRGIRCASGPLVPKGTVLRALGDEATGLRCVLALGHLDALEQVTASESAREEVQEFLDKLLTRVCERVQHLLLQASLEHSEESLGEGRDFLAHQVRSRLDMIVGYQEMVQKLLRGVEEREDFDAEDENLTTTIGDLVEFTTLAQERQPFYIAPTTLHWETIAAEPLVESVLDHHAIWAAREQVELKKGDMSPARIRADPFWLRTLLMHVVHNAIKYSRRPQKAGKRWVEVSAFPDGPNLVVVVENFGLGILADNVETIFEKDVRIVDGTRFEHKLGMGRGLWEARRIASLFDGRIWARSRHHSGGPVTEANIEECITTFGVEIPLHRERWRD